MVTPTHEIPEDILGFPLRYLNWTNAQQSRFAQWFATLPDEVIVSIGPEFPGVKSAWELAVGSKGVPGDPLLQFFAYDHLPPHLRDVSEPFWQLAHRISTTLPRNPERTVALRKLLEAKDCAVRAMIYKTS